MGRILAVDLGDARTGLAVSDPQGFLAGGIGYIPTKGLSQVAKEVAAKACELACELIIIGYPLNMNGTEGPRAEKSKLFSEMLSKLTETPIKLYDERLTTSSAHVYLSATNINRKKRRQVVDTLSAEIMLQNYLDSHRR